MATFSFSSEISFLNYQPMESRQGQECVGPLQAGGSEQKGRKYGLPSPQERFSGVLSCPSFCLCDLLDKGVLVGEACGQNWGDSCWF